MADLRLMRGCSGNETFMGVHLLFVLGIVQKNACLFTC